MTNQELLESLEQILWLYNETLIWIGSEIDKDYYDAAVNRFHNETEQEALF